MYIERGLKAPLQRADGTRVDPTPGTPQGGVSGPVLANLFRLLKRLRLGCNRELPGCRYADEGLIHGKTEAQAQGLKAELAARLAECGLELHPAKTRIV